MSPGTDPSGTRVLVVEDDASLAAWIVDYLRSHGLQVELETSGDRALAALRDRPPDAVVLDLGLPVVDGLAVCRRARAFYDRPILMLTARDSDEDEVRGFEFGADDYLIKPVRPRVLLARLQALLRRHLPTASLAPSYRIGVLHLDVAVRSVSLDGEPLALSTQEFDVLALLAASAGQPVDRQTLSTRLRGLDYDTLDRAVDLAVSRLRRKLGDPASAPRWIKTVRGRGYLLGDGRASTVDTR